MEVSSEFLEAFDKSMSRLQDLMDEAARYILEHGHPKELSKEEKFKNNLKFARGVNNRIVFVHKETMVAYKTGDYGTGYELKIPYEEDKEFEFERWCTSMDI